MDFSLLFFFLFFFIFIGPFFLPSFFIFPREWFYDGHGHGHGSLSVFFGGSSFVGLDVDRVTGVIWRMDRYIIGGVNGQYVHAHEN